MFQRCNNSNSSLSYLSHYDGGTGRYEDLSIENLLQNKSSRFINTQQLLDIFRWDFSKVTASKVFSFSVFIFSDLIYMSTMLFTLLQEICLLKETMKCNKHLHI
jgi:hypothetical protein